MKFSIAASIALLASGAVAHPTKTSGQLDQRAVVAKRATVTDACDVGFATQNGGTKGGAGGSTTTVSSYAQFSAAAKSSGALVIVVRGALTGSKRVDISSDKTVVGAAGSSLTGIGLRVKDARNVIIRNMKIAKVSQDGGDAIAIQKSTNIWVDHCDLSSDLANGKDFYDGLCDITHAADFITVSNTFFHDHFKVSLVGHSDSNAAEDTGKLRVTYANNRWDNIGSRLPSIRFGTGHVFNNYWNKVATSGVNTRMGAQVLVESSVFENSNARAVVSIDSTSTGGAVVRDVLFGGSSRNSAPAGSLTSVPYRYTVLGSAAVKAAVTREAGQTLAF